MNAVISEASQIPLHRAIILYFMKEVYSLEFWTRSRSSAFFCVFYYFILFSLM